MRLPMSDPLFVPAWVIILLTINFQLALALELFSYADLNSGFPDFSDPELVGIGIAFLFIPAIVYYAIYSERYWVLVLLLIFDVLDLADKLTSGGGYGSARAVLFVGFWIVPITLLWINRSGVRQYLSIRIFRRR